MINRYTFIGKTVEDAILEAEENLNKKRDNLLIKEQETKKSLFNKKIEIEVIDKDDVILFIKNFLIETITNIGLDAKIETKKRDDTLTFGIYCNNNAILIGKSGRTIDALQTITRQVVSREINQNFSFILDVSEYKKRNQIRLEKLAKYTAKDVATTKIEVKLEPMNSYERRLIHNILGESKDVYTESVGEEPNRCVIIKPKGE